MYFKQDIPVILPASFDSVAVWPTGSANLNTGNSVIRCPTASIVTRYETVRFDKSINVGGLKRSSYGLLVGKPSDWENITNTIRLLHIQGTAQAIQQDNSMRLIFGVWYVDTAADAINAVGTAAVKQLCPYQVSGMGFASINTVVGIPTAEKWMNTSYGANSSLAVALSAQNPTNGAWSKEIGGSLHVHWLDQYIEYFDPRRI